MCWRPDADRQITRAYLAAAPLAAVPLAAVPFDCEPGTLLNGWGSSADSTATASMAGCKMRALA